MRRRRSVCTFAAVAAAVLLAGCSTVVVGQPVSVFADPFKVAGMRAVDGPTGLRPDAREQSRDVNDSDGGKIDQIAGASVSDIEQFWESAFNEAFPGSFKPVSQLVSWNADDYEGTFCEEDTYGLVNAAFCPLDNTIGWDRGVLLPALRRANGDMAITMVLAHEYGHSVQKQAKFNRRGTSVLVAEQQADCLAGTYMRWVAEGNSPRFTLSTGDGLNNLLAGMISFRDPLLSVEDVYSGRRRRRTWLGIRTDLGVPVRIHRRRRPRARRSTTKRWRSAAAICRWPCSATRVANGRCQKSR